MKTLIMALVALSVVTGIAPVANAFDSKSFYEQQDRQSGGSNWTRKLGARQQSAIARAPRAAP